MGLVVVGLDVGQRRDPSAIAVVEAEEEDTGRKITTYKPDGALQSIAPEQHDVFRLRYLGRLPLGTPYPQVAAEVGRLLERLAGHDRQRLEAAPSLFTDATGVGTPVIDMIHGELRDVDCRVVSATFTGQDRVDGGFGSDSISVGKPYLVSRLQALLQTGRIRSSLNRKGERQLKALRDELLNYEIRVNANAHLEAGAFKTGTHDDLATALGLAVLFDPHLHRVTIGPDIWELPDPW